ncbi:MULTISPECIES: DUF3649 domain-containing protein [unclassified Pseudomonas]|jgi:hypothetical protein|uniref:Uncharacterized protein n=1 Tax=Pseudomonas gorinensis TaxID=3240790 RepID=A0ACA7P1N1_9PSED|nr:MULTISPECIES: DUF3649 domain-containing protein [unclassified Pseudomonas]AHC33821.1 hypothetical protein U771_06370 [Pseudomonas sp. TKP]MBL1306273.1 DUF3649 domain-containing protein [Pseudomonas sp.]PMX10901.1 DUF3649 domain-containing protein [Pseudomonas sp. MPBC4-3]PMX44919.1 DUF3649 domain-containing protein [Pseudomonas sp. FW301-21B01]PMY04961.1 DUF3649 domain-containing protein [Pseudomonas sp. MPR-R5A]
MKSKTSLPVSYRLAVTSRVLAAVVGGYLMASLASICLALWLPTSRADAVIVGMMSSFVFYLLAVLWCFACRTAGRAWLGVMAPCVLFATLAGAGWWVARP